MGPGIISSGLLPLLEDAGLPPAVPFWLIVDMMREGCTVVRWLPLRCERVRRVRRCGVLAECTATAAGGVSASDDILRSARLEEVGELCAVTT